MVVALASASFIRSIKDVCENIRVTNNIVANNPDPWYSIVNMCTAAGNAGEDKLEGCMKSSMHPKKKSMRMCRTRIGNERASRPGDRGAMPVVPSD